VPKDEVEDYEGRHDAEHALQDKLKSVLHHEERDRLSRTLLRLGAWPPDTSPRRHLTKLVTLSISKTARENTCLVVISRSSTHAYALVSSINNR
jgi:hypothetical protein